MRVVSISCVFLLLTPTLSLGPCESGLAHDLEGPRACQGWCSPSKRRSHCAWCKCQECSFCGGASEVAQRSTSPGLEDSAQSQRGGNRSPLFRVDTGSGGVNKRQQDFVELDDLLGASFPGVPRLPDLNSLTPHEIAMELGEYVRTLRAHSEAAGSSSALAEFVAAFLTGEPMPLLAGAVFAGFTKIPAAKPAAAAPSAPPPAPPSPHTPPPPPPPPPHPAYEGKRECQLRVKPAELCANALDFVLSAGGTRGLCSSLRRTKLSFVQGHELRCDAAPFGGFSGIDLWAEDGGSAGQLVAVTDAGWWTELPADPLSATCGAGDCHDVTVAMHQIIDQRGEPLWGAGDAEGVAVLPGGGGSLVSLQDPPRIFQYAKV